MFPVCNIIYFPESPQRAYDVFAVTTAQEPDSKLRWKRLLRAERGLHVGGDTGHRMVIRPNPAGGPRAGLDLSTLYTHTHTHMSLQKPVASAHSLL